MFRFAALFYRLVKLAYIKMLSGHEAFLDALIDFVKDYGGLYVKFTQLLAMQTTLFPKKQAVRLLTFYDNVGWEPFDIHKFLQREMSSEAYLQISYIESNPFASGAFAQVYKGNLTNGTQVIFKVKKRGLKWKLFVDFLLLRMFVYALDAIYTVPMFNPHKLFKEFKVNIKRELDYTAEVDNALTMYSYYKNNPQVFVPFTYKELSSKNVIVQDYINGLPMTKLILAKHSNTEDYLRLISEYEIDIPILLKTLGYDLCTQGARFEKFFGDPHPGNIILLGGIKYAFIDFGVLDDMKFDRANYYRIMEFIMALSSESDFGKISRDLLKFGAEDLYQALLVLDEALMGRRNSDTSIMDVVSHSYTELLGKNSSVFVSLLNNSEKDGFSNVFFEMVKMGNKFNIQIPAMLFNIIRSSVMYSSYVEYLMPETKTSFMGEIYSDMLDEFQEFKTMGGYSYGSDVELEKAVQYVLEWVSGIAERDAHLFARIARLVRKASNV